MGAVLVPLLVAGSARKPTFDGTLRVVTEQCKYSTLAEHALNTTCKLSTKQVGVMACDLTMFTKISPQKFSMFLTGLSGVGCWQVLQSSLRVCIIWSSSCDFKLLDATYCKTNVRVNAWNHNSTLITSALICTCVWINWVDSLSRNFKSTLWTLNLSQRVHMYRDSTWKTVKAPFNKIL